jgi:tRNA U55 pseudouridine synthase TruB
LVRAQARFKVGSGTYVRSLIHDLGKKLGTFACCIHIKRVSVGRYDTLGILLD